MWWLSLIHILDDLARATVTVDLPEICPIPIHFIPGIKNAVEDISVENYEAMDIMRGEEVESIALMDRFFDGNPMLLVLPGSHNKFVAVDASGKITGCLTSISGELLASITNDTILAKSVGRKFVEEASYDKEWLLLGYENAKKTGLGRACFSGRILSLFVEEDTEKIANYILGASLQGEDVYKRQGYDRRGRFSKVQHKDYDSSFAGYRQICGDYFHVGIDGDVCPHIDHDKRGSWRRLQISTVSNVLQSLSYGAIRRRKRDSCPVHYPVYHHFHID